MGETADALRRAVGGGLQGFQQLRTGELHNAQCVAEGQNGVDVLLGDVTLSDGSTDATSVGDSRIHLDACVLGAPDQCIGDQIAQVGLAGADISLHAVQVYLSLGEDGAVILVDLRLDGGGTVSHCLIGSDDQVLSGKLHGFGAVIGDDHHAHIVQLGAGGGQQGVAHHTGAVGGLHDGLQVRVGVAVDEDVDALNFLQQVGRAVSGGLGVNAQVAQTDDDVTAFGLQGIHLRLGTIKHRLAAQELHILDLGGVGLCGGLRGSQTEHTDLHAAGAGESHIVLEGRFALVQHVGSHHGELGLTGQLGQVGIAIVELMVAGGDHIITSHVHQFHGRGTLGDADHGVALNEVTCVHQQDIGTHLLIGILQRGHLGILRNGTVDVIGVQDHNGACQVVVVGLHSTGGDGQGKHHNQGQQQRQQLLRLHSFTSFKI